MLPVSPSHCRGMKPALLLATFTLSWHYGGSLHSFTLTGGSSGPSGDVLRHGLQILVPMRPEAVTVRVHRVEGKIFLPNPCVEDFRHIGADLGQSFLFISCEFFLGAFVVHSVVSWSYQLAPDLGFLEDNLIVFFSQFPFDGDLISLLVLQDVQGTFGRRGPFCKQCCTKTTTIFFICLVGLPLVHLLLHEHGHPCLLFLEFLLKFFRHVLVSALVVSVDLAACLCEEAFRKDRDAMHRVQIDAGWAVVDVILGVHNESCSLEDSVHVSSGSRFLEGRTDQLVEGLKSDVIKKMIREIEVSIVGVVSDSSGLVLHPLACPQASPCHALVQTHIKECLHKLHVKDAEGCIIQEVAHQDTTRLTSQEVEFWCATRTGMTIKVEPGLVVPDLRHEDAAAERALASARLAQENQSRLTKVPNLLQGGEDGTVIEQG